MCHTIFFILLGELCGLLPLGQPTSQQLHFVVELSSGIRDKIPESANSENSAPPSPGKICPVDRLKEALSSKTAFEKYYLVRLIFEMVEFEYINNVLFQLTVKKKQV